MQRIYKNQAKNFRQQEVVQVMRDGEWKDYTKPCGSKLVIEFTLRAERLYGIKNVRVVRVST